MEKIKKAVLVPVEEYECSVCGGFDPMDCEICGEELDGGFFCEELRSGNSSHICARCFGKKGVKDGKE